MDGRRSTNPHPPPRGTAVLDVKPLRSLSPMFPPAMSLAATAQPGTSPFVCITPFDLDGQVSQSSYTYFTPASKKSHYADANVNADTNKNNNLNANAKANAHVNVNVNADTNKNNNVNAKANAHVNADTVFGMNGTPTPLSQTPPMIVAPLNEDAGMCEQRTSSRGRKIKMTKHYMGLDYVDSYIAEGSTKKKPRKKIANVQDLHLLSAPLDDPRLLVDSVLMIFDGLRRRLLQIEEVNQTTRRPDLKAGAILMDNDIRINKGKTMGSIPGIHVGDIFYFRFELCLLGLHAPSMAGIDYMSPRLNDETVAISIVSSGGYEDDSDDVDVLVYTGQGGSKANDSTKQIDDQKLERGNLALENSLHKGNVVRVVRAAKDLTTIGGKIYYYDGLYKVKESWTEKGKAGFHVFKYKLLREPEQPGGHVVWKMTEKWRAFPASRGGLILPDISSGKESHPVCLVNEVDSEKGPDIFTYSTKVRYLRPLSSANLQQGCSCESVCLPGDRSCFCVQQNGGDLPYSATGLLANRKRLVYECGPLCKCSNDCRNRLTQRGTRLRFEVFRTSNSGWGLRSWDPIRAGSFICEYTGEVIDIEKVEYNMVDDDYIFPTNQIADKNFRWNYVPELLGEPSHDDDAEEVPNQLPIIISAKRIGNISRFMNHSCYPNVLWQPVQHDHADEGHPHIMFFSMKHIPPMTELTYDYGRSDCQPKQCLCGCSRCRGFFG